MQVPEALKWLVGVATSAFIVGFGTYKALQVYRDAQSTYISEKVAEQVGVQYAKLIQKAGVPIGTIVASAHPLDRIQEANSKSVVDWLPCDGREAPMDSAYRKHIADRLPDLRGVFLRGANTMAEGAPAPVADRLNPDATAIGGYQADEFRTHNHTGGFDYWQHEGEGGPTVRGVIIPGSKRSGRAESSVPNDGGMETRPKNISVAYFIKVN